MINGRNFLLSGFAAIFCLFSCANIANLEGGDKDKTPPQPDSLRSSKNYQKGFRKQEIVLSFNEWIKFDDPSQVIISPPLEKKPTFQLKGKTIKIKFDDAEILRANTTYTLNFSESVKDITEGNKSNFRFVFSTGERIDSNTLRFTVVDGLKNEPLENILVMVYEELGDSVVSKEMPLYFAKTGKKGFCSIENVRDGSFRIFALQDGNQNFKYDLPTEKTGFISSPIRTERESVRTHNIRLFEPDLPIGIKQKHCSDYGLLKFVFSKNAVEISPHIENVGQRSIIEYQQDTLRIWFHQNNDEPWKCIVMKDTNIVRTSGRPAFLQTAKLQLQQERKTTNTSEKRHPALPLEWNFNHPIVGLDSSKFTIEDDSSKRQIKLLRLTTDSVSPRKVKIGAAWQENHHYTLTALPGAFTDLFGIASDSLTQTVQMGQLKNFGEVSLKIFGLDENVSYLVELLGPNDLTALEKIKKGNREQLLTFKNLIPAVYEVRVTEDLNQNGRLDSGNYYEKRQPERIVRKKLDELKPNWTLEAEIRWQ